MTRAQRAQSQTAVTQSRVARATSTRPGSVAFVGSGPGDPGLLTVRAADLIREAEIVITEGPEHPALVRALLGLPEGSEGGPELVDGGFGEDGQPLTHAARAKVVVREVKRGARVVRMLTGDPFVYASGPEEAAACARAGLDFEIVPGVSSIAAVPASALIPVTHRGVSDRVTIASGHGADGGEPDYESLAATGGTLVLFMGLERIEQLCRGLVAAGLPSSTPAAVVSRGTLPDQESVSGTLETLAELATGLESPALVIIGDVVAVGARLAAAVKVPAIA